MSLPTMHGTGRLTSDGELRYTPAGMAVFSVTIAFTARRKNDDGEWVDGDTFFVQSSLFREPAEHAAESFRKGDEVMVIGRIKTDQWNDKETGEKRSKPSLLIDGIGPTTRRGPVSKHREEQPAWGGGDDAPF